MRKTQSRSKLHAASLSLNVLTIAVSVVGIIAESVRPHNPHPTWTYFTVDSAAMLCISLVVHSRVKTYTYLFDTAAPGVFLSAVTYWPLIFPAVRPRSAADWLAAVLLHAALPAFLLLILLFVKGPRVVHHRALCWSLLYPSIYLGVVIGLQLNSGVEAPYSFLSLEKHGWTGVLAISVVLGLVYSGLWIGVQRLHVARDRTSPWFARS